MALDPAAIARAVVAEAMAPAMPPALPEHQGRLYAHGSRIMVAPRRDPVTGRTYLGGPIADAQDAETAREIVRRCHAYERLLAAASAVHRHITEMPEAPARQAALAEITNAIMQALQPGLPFDEEAGLAGGQRG